MAFSISTNNLPSRSNFSSYANALHFYNSVKPKRDGSRPLATNRKGPFEIRLDNYTKNIQLIYHSTSVVTITPDNKLILDLRWNSVSTRLFADALSPPGLRVLSFKGNNVVAVRNEAGGYSRYITDTATFDLTGVKLIEGQTRVAVRSVNTKLTSEPRRILRAIEKFLSAAVAINPTYLDNLRYSPPMESQIPNASDPETFLPLVRATVRMPWPTSDLPVLIKRLKLYLYDDYEVYDWTTLPDGVLPTKGQTYHIIKEN